MAYQGGGKGGIKLDNVLLKHLIHLARNIPSVGGFKALREVYGNGFTGVHWSDVPQQVELEHLEKLGYIKLIIASGQLFDIWILNKALHLFN